jgi:glycerol-3-phosphate dehydrogenase
MLAFHNRLIKLLNLAKLSPMNMVPSRQIQINRLSRETFDLLVIGGGATGTGIALDAATCGLKVALVERGDFSSGTSSRSTKLIHGGVRYLESAIKHLDRKEFHLVTDALHERKTLLTIAPHLTRPLPLVTPLYTWMDVPYYLTGLKLYDWISRRASLGASSYISATHALERFPMLKQEGLKGAVVYYDGQFDDARMNVTIALTAAEKGAVIANYAEVRQLIKKEGRLTGVECADLIGGSTFTLSAKSVINATGPFADGLRLLDEPNAPPLVAPSSGTHIILDQKHSPPGTGLLIPHTDDGRVLFLLPWEGATLAGTTDQPCEVEAEPRPHEEEVTYILTHLNRYFDITIDRSDVRASWAGIRPLARDPHAASTSELARDHVIAVSPSGLITICGGKWTTYRRMAQEAVQRAIEVGELTPSGESETEHTLLRGAEGFTPELARELEVTHKVTASIARYLAHAYGTFAPLVADSGPLTPLHPDHHFVEAEVLYGVKYEYAQHAVDLLARRTRLAFLDNAAAHHALPRVIELMASALDWDEARRREEREHAQRFLKTMHV